MKVTRRVGNQYSGYIGDYIFFITTDKNCQVIDPITLETIHGDGIHILTLYQDKTTTEGNPYLPDQTTRRQISAKHNDQGWELLHSSVISEVRELVTYITRRSKIAIV